MLNKLLTTLLMFYPPHLRRMIRAYEGLVADLCKEIIDYDIYIEEKLLEVGFADWEINGKNNMYIPSAKERIDLFVDKIKEYEKTK